jgi:arylsulfatase A-like enzyme
MARKRSDRPNVVVFFVDQQRWDTTGVHNCPLDLTPNFDRFARQGTHLYNAITCQPVCAPARASLQTGLYATETTVHRNGVALPKDQKTLAHYFGEAGYQTGYIGKWHLGSQDPVPEDEQGGYDFWLGANLLEFVSEPYHTVLYDKQGEAHELPGYRVDAITDEAIRYIDGHKEEPFFLFLSYLEPHHQNHLDDYVAPDGYRERYSGAWMPPDLQALGGSSYQHWAGYCGIIRRLDEALGRLQDALKSLELDEDTIVVYTSDHGSHFKTRNSEYKRSCHDGCTHIPAAIWGPGFQGGGQVREMVSLVDLPPTLVDAAGVGGQEEMQGRSILPLLRGERQGWPGEVFLQISEAQVGRALRTRKWKYSVVAPGADTRTDMGSDRYVEEFLYDLEADPYELTNLIGVESHQGVAARLRQTLIERMVHAGETAPTIEPAPSRPKGQRRVLEGGEKLNPSMYVH